MSFSNPSELFLLARICFVRLMVFSISACLVFVASSERKISLLPSMAIHISVTTCDACAADQVVRFTRPSPSVFAYCKRSKTGAGEGLGTRLQMHKCRSFVTVFHTWKMAMHSAHYHSLIPLAYSEGTEFLSNLIITQEG